MNALSQLGAFLAYHWAAISAFAGVAAVAFVCTMPPNRPRSLDEWWTWLRNGLQTAVPAARHNENPTSPNPKEQK